MAKHGKTRMTPVAPTIDVDELGQLGDLFTLSDLPADLAPAVMQFLQTSVGRRVFWLWLLLKAPPCRVAYVEALGGGYLHAVAAAAESWHSLPQDTHEILDNCMMLHVSSHMFSHVHSH